MKDQTSKALDFFRKEIKKAKLELDKEYKCNYQTKCLGEEINIDKIKFRLFIDRLELAPCLVADSGDFEFYFMSPEFTIDKYDRNAIISNIEEKYKSFEEYSISLLKDFTKSIGVII